MVMLTDPKQYSPLVLAYIGDAVYELYVRKMLISKANTQVDKLHKSAISIVKAETQCEAFRKIEQELSEEEMSVFKRGRNTKSSVPKHATVLEYRIATGLEALVGYIYMTGNKDRLDYLMNIILGE
ncbi:MAG: ribonuclease III [Clostridia bacterium]|nr:ribonuclease III [Clostridia bacterium]